MLSCVVGRKLSVCRQASYYNIACLFSLKIITITHNMCSKVFVCLIVNILHSTLESIVLCGIIYWCSGSSSQACMHNIMININPTWLTAWTCCLLLSLIVSFVLTHKLLAISYPVVQKYNGIEILEIIPIRILLIGEVP